MCSSDGDRIKGSNVFKVPSTVLDQAHRKCFLKELKLLLTVSSYYKLLEAVKFLFVFSWHLKFTTVIEHLTKCETLSKTPWRIRSCEMHGVCLPELIIQGRGSTWLKNYT